MSYSSSMSHYESLYLDSVMLTKKVFITVTNSFPSEKIGSFLSTLICLNLNLCY